MQVRSFPGYRKGSVIFHGGDGYYYYKNRAMRAGRISLRCVLAKKLLCPGRASMDHHTMKITSNHMYHGPNKDFKKIRHMRHNILERCATKDPTDFSEIVEQEGERFSRRVRAQNHHVTLRSAMRRSRSKSYPVLPESVSELGALLRQRENRTITETKDGFDNTFFGAVGSTRQKTRCVIFMTRRIRRYLRKAKVIFADGTFKSRPAKPDSRQVFSICTIWRGHILPLAVVIMQGRREEAYVEVLQVLRDQGLNPNIVHTDFEGPMFEAFRTVFPGAPVKGCLVHYIRRLRLQAGKLHLTRFVRNNLYAKRIVRCCGAIPLLPRNQMRLALRDIIRYAKRHGVFRRLKAFLRYIKNTWLGRYFHVLSVYAEEHRTNNVSESWNRVLRRAVKVKRPNLWIFLAALVRLEDRTEQDLYSLRRGLDAKRLRKVSAVTNDRSICRLSANLRAGWIDRLTFLRHASHRMHAVWNPLM